MTGPLHVLVYGPVEAGICDFYRFGMYAEPLLEHGVELRAFHDYRYIPGAGHDDPLEALAQGDVILDRSEIDWADVIVFRRFYQTRWNCAGCQLTSTDPGVLEAHAAVTGHGITAPERLVRPLFDALEAHPALLRGRAIVYETDDDLLRVQPWNGIRQRIAPERDLVERLMRRADLVTVSTPVLAARAHGYNDAVRVVRNAVDTTWADGVERRPGLEGDPRILYHGLAARWRDYVVCRDAVDETKRRFPDARRVWLGATGAPALGGLPERVATVVAAVDETLPFVHGIPEFQRALAAAGPDIGLAPVVGDDFDRAKSELHWIEYSLAGAATVASRTPGGGPYDVIRPGVDGLVARGRSQWLEHLTALAGSRTLREELAGRARERVLAEYDVKTRAAEWADAYRWAAEHAGRGTLGRIHASPRDRLRATLLEREAVEGLEHRRRARSASEDAPAALVAARGDRDVCWAESDAADPLVTVIVPVRNEPQALVTRAVASALAQTHARLQVVVAAPPRWTAPADPTWNDPRVEIVPVPGPATLPMDAVARVRADEAAALRSACAAARGAWIAPLLVEGEFLPDHVATLLEVAVEYRLEFVYGQASVEFPGAPPLVLGTWPPNVNGVLPIGTELFSARLTSIVPYDDGCWREGTAAGWSHWRDLLAAGVRAAGIEQVVTWLRPVEADAVPESPGGHGHATRAAAAG